jgi:very-short-patch-repair endonuclease
MNSDEYKHKQRISKLGNKNGMYGKTHSIKTRKKLSECLKQRMKDPLNIEKLKNRQWTKEQIEKHKQSINNPKRLEILRKHRLNQIKKSGGTAAFNELACKYFNMINKKLKLNGYHALNGGEKEFIGYSLDYYDPKLKLIIEWDEKRHHEPKIREKDLIRQEKLLNALQCQFYRIDEKNKKVYKVDNNFTNTDLTKKLQNTLNEFKK